MIRHLWALTWNRRRTSALLLVELFVTFLVLLALVTSALWFWDAYRQPLGYSIQDVWRVTIGRPRQSHQGSAPPNWAVNRQLMAAVRALPQVANMAGTDGSYPYSGGGGAMSLRGRRYLFTSATDELPAVLGLDVIAGRWFNHEDAGISAVVLTKPAALELFGKDFPIGEQIIGEWKNFRPLKVVGIISDYRARGEFGIREEFFFRRLEAEGSRHDDVHALLVKVRPGTPSAFEETLVKTMQAVAKDWSFQVTPIEERRDRNFQQIFVSFAGVLVLAGYLILMVVLGLSGVVWQNVTQRRSEIGLRRALGATAGDVQRQFLGELMAMATLAMIAGGLVFLNFAAVIGRLPVFGDYVTWQVYLAGFAISVVSLYGLVIVSGSLPTRLAARVQPLEALRHE